MNKSIIVHDLGLVEYEKALEYQLNLFNEIIESKLSNRRSNSNIITKNHLVFVEHPHVYTLGKSGDISNLLIDHNELKKNDTKFYKINILKIKMKKIIYVLILSIFWVQNFRAFILTSHERANCRTSSAYDHACGSWDTWSRYRICDTDL